MAYSADPVPFYRKPLRVGLAGAGWVTQHHLPAWRAHTGRAEVVALADPNSNAVEDRRREFGIPQGYRSVEAMIEGADIDILDVCAPREFHTELVKLGADRGIAVICQKPLARTLAEGQTLAGALPVDARVMIHDNWRFRAPYRWIKGWLDSGEIGDVRHVQLDYFSCGMIPDATGARPAIVRQPMFLGLGRLLVMEVLIHQLDALAYLFGDLELIDATMSRSNDDIIGEDAATLRLRTKSGLPIELVGDLAVHGEQTQARDQLLIVGDGATVTLDGWTLRRAGPRPVDHAFDPVADYLGSYSGTIGHFLDCLASGAPFEITPAVHLKALAIAEAAYAFGAARGYASPTANRGQP